MIWYSLNNRLSREAGLKSFDELFRKNKKVRLVFKTKKNLILKFKEWQQNRFKKPLKQNLVEWHHYDAGGRFDGGQYRLAPRVFQQFLKDYFK